MARHVIASWDVKRFRRERFYVAERGRFELPRPFQVYTLSKRAH